MARFSQEKQEVDKRIRGGDGEDEFDGAVGAALNVWREVLAGGMDGDAGEIIAAAESLFGLGMLEEAGDVFDYAVGRAAGKKFEALCGLARVRVAMMGKAPAGGEDFMGLAREAVELFEAAFRTRRPGGRPLSEYVTLLLLIDRYDDADEVLAEGVFEQAGGDSLIDLLYLKGMSLLGSGSYQGARDYFNRITEEDPSRWEGVFGVCLSGVLACDGEGVGELMDTLRAGDLSLYGVVASMEGRVEFRFRDVVVEMAQGDEPGGGLVDGARPV